MWVSLKRMEEEDLIFMNSVHCFIYFQIFKSFPGHQQKLHNASGAPFKLMACWARPPPIELMAHGHLLVSAPGFWGEKGGEEVSPDCYTTRQRGILACWYQGPLARTSPPNLSSPRPISAHFLTLIFFFHRETARPAGMDQTQRVPYTHSENNSAPLLATGIAVPALLRDDSNTSTYTWILSNFNKLQ